MNINYTLTGTIEVPAGSRLSASGTSIVLPDGERLMLWEAWEIDEGKDLTYDELAAIGCSYDAPMAKFTQ